jgi:hypothetical protein
MNMNDLLYGCLWFLKLLNGFFVVSKIIGYLMELCEHVSNIKALYKEMLYGDIEILMDISS